MPQCVVLTLPLRALWRPCRRSALAARCRTSSQCRGASICRCSCARSGDQLTSSSENERGAVPSGIRTKLRGSNVRGCRCWTFEISEIKYERGQKRQRSQVRRDKQSAKNSCECLKSSSEIAATAAANRHGSGMHRAERVCQIHWGARPPVDTSGAEQRQGCWSAHSSSGRQTRCGARTTVGAAMPEQNGGRVALALSAEAADRRATGQGRRSTPHCRSGTAAARPYTG